MTKEELDRFLKNNGGVSKKTLALLGLNWPPKKGWKKRVCSDYDKQRSKRRAAQRKKRNARKRVSNGFYRSAEWARLRYDALEASEGKCELCGRSGKDETTLHVDHIKPIKKHPHLARDPSNLQVLCAACNWGKGNRYDTDWREPKLAKLMGEEL